MKILLINPPATYSKGIAQKCYPPMNLLYLSSALSENKIENLILDSNALRLNITEIVEFVKNEKPDLIGLPVFSLISKKCKDIIKGIKKKIPGIKFVVGGPEASAIPERVLSEFSDVEFLLAGESEYSLVQLCKIIGNANKSDFYLREKELSEISNLVYKSNGMIKYNKKQDYITDLDKLAFPDREKVKDIYKKKLYYTVLLKEKSIDTIVTSRGCPYSCKFCYNKIHKYRIRSAENVIDEIFQLYKRGIKDIEIVDDSFTIDRNRAIKIFNYIIKERLNTISFRIKSRVDAVDEELLKIAKAAGVYIVSFGCESYSKEILEKVNKKITQKQINDAITLTKNSGIYSHTSWIIGFPGETPETIKETVSFIKGVKPTTVNINILIPYPQTDFYNEAKLSGTLVGDWSFDTDYIPWIKLSWTRDFNDLKKILTRSLKEIYLKPYYIYFFSKQILLNMNSLLMKYGLQELQKLIKNEY